jgi:hypothetical protein
MQGTASLVLPRRSRGYQSDAAAARYQADLEAFCAAIREIKSRLDFRVSSRGWCYVLENEAGLPKGDFDKAQEVINDCRKSGMLPLDICAEDSAREFDGLDRLDYVTPEERAGDLLDYVQRAYQYYTPISFWESQAYYLQLVVEKIDLKSLFAGICGQFHIPNANTRGWCDINTRADMMQRFKAWEAKGKQCVLLYCGDFDPVGLQISDVLRDNLEELSGQVGWHPDHLIIDRFGLNKDWIEAQDLTWIQGLTTGSGNDLGDPDHKHHQKAYVQEHIRQNGKRKVEANAMVVRPEPSRALLRETILRYLPADAPARYRQLLTPIREQVRVEVMRLLQSMAQS